jgi:hypothetical protein
MSRDLKRVNIRAIAAAAAVFAVLALSLPAAGQQASGGQLSTATERLFDAVVAKDIVAVRISLNDGADPAAQNRDGLTAADLAVDNGYYDIAHLILNTRNQSQDEQQAAARAAANPVPAELLPAAPAPAPARSATVTNSAGSRLIVNVPGLNPNELESPAPAPASPQTAPQTAVPPSPSESSSVASSRTAIARPGALPPVVSGRPMPIGPTTPVWPEGKPNPFEPTGAANAGLPTLTPGQQSAAAASARPGIAGSATEAALAPASQAPAIGPGPSENAPPSQVSSVSAAPPIETGPVEGFFKRLTNTMPGNLPSSGEGSARSAETARLSDAAAPAPAPEPRRVLANVPLSLGRSEIIGRTPGPERLSAPECFQPGAGQPHFCVEDVDWPPELTAKMMVESRLYNGAKTIVQYDRGRATRAFSLFPSGGFAEVLAYFMDRLGPPTDKEERIRSILAGRREPIVVYRWESVDQRDDSATVLEIRNFDDVRTRRPDTEFGVIRVFAKGSTEIFDQISDRAFLLRRGGGNFGFGVGTATQSKPRN